MVYIVWLLAIPSVFVFGWEIRIVIIINLASIILFPFMHEKMISFENSRT